MYGEGEVLSSMGGNGVSQETLFSSPNQNLGFNYMANMPFDMFSPMVDDGTTKSKEDMESGSGSEPFEGGISGNEQEGDEHQQPIGPPNKKKPYHRHTPHQIQEMETLFRQNPHPDDKQRMKLSNDLGLKPRQVKFWFQNRRTQLKAQHDRAHNASLRAENESIKHENYQLQSALRKNICSNCGSSCMLSETAANEKQLRLENARLKDELEYMSSLVVQYSGHPIQSVATPPSFLTTPLDMGMNLIPRKYEQHTPLNNCAPEMMIPLPLMPGNPNNFPAGSFILEEEKSLASELALSFMDELVKMSQMGEPLWFRPDDQSGRDILNVGEYSRMFPCPPSDIKQPIRTEATRHTSLVIMNSITLVDAFLDANKWIELFPSIISKAKTLQIIAAGASRHPNGSLVLMYAELQVVSPLVPTRETHFLRYCQQNEDGTWIIVDFPLDNFHTNYPLSYPNYKRRPSGCVIRDLPNGSSRITWVEHAEVEESPVHKILDQFVSSGMAFGAQRWLAVLQQQCERFTSLMARNVSDLGVIPSLEARRNLMCLAQRMVRTFCLNMSTAYGQSWTSISDPAESTIRITTRKGTEPGQINGLILTGVITTWLPYPHYQVFDLLRNEHRRAQLDILSNGNGLQEVAHIANGSHPGNCISILRMKVANNSSQQVDLMLQESGTNESGSLVVYTTVNVDAIQEAMTGQDTSYMPLLPLGFIVVPMNHPTENSDSNIGLSEEQLGCLVSVGFQVLESTLITAKVSLPSVNAIIHHLSSTAEKINAALSSSVYHNGNGSNEADNGSALASPTEASASAENVQQKSPGSPQVEN